MSKKVWLPIMGTAVLISLGAGQVSAEDQPLTFSSTVTVRADEACKFEVTQPTASTATATYKKGEDGTPGKVSIETGAMKFGVKAKGGPSCGIKNVQLKAQYSVPSIIGDGGVYGATTKNGEGYYPVNWGLSDVVTTTASDIAPQGTLTWSNGRKNTNEVTLPLGAASLRGSDTAFNRFSTAGDPAKIVKLAWNGNVIATDDNPATLRNPYNNADSHQTINVKNTGENWKEVTMSITPMVGVGPYNATTHERDEAVVEDDELFSATATVTVTAT